MTLSARRTPLRQKKAAALGPLYQEGAVMRSVTGGVFVSPPDRSVPRYEEGTFCCGGNEKTAGRDLPARCLRHYLVISEIFPEMGRASGWLLPPRLKSLKVCALFKTAVVTVVWNVEASVMFST